MLDAERVSVDGDFFAALGANSLLLARFTARVRRAAPELGPVSMRDVYLHPTVRRLAAALRAGVPDRDALDAEAWTDPVLPEPTGTPRQRVCAALQLLLLLSLLGLAGVALDAGASWVFGASGVLDAYVRAVAFGTGTLLGAGLLPIAAKWILIGRFAPQRIRVWSLAYVRFWVVKTMLVANPLPHLLIDTSLYPLYLRALGARVGNRALILSQHLPVCTDLLTIGADTVIHKDVYLAGYRARAGLIEIGPVAIGERAIVGEHAVLDIHTALGDGAQLGTASSLHAGQAVPAGECWHGSPGRRAPEGWDYRTEASAPTSKPLRIRYAAFRLGVLVAVLGPLEAVLAALLLTHPRFIERIPPAAVPGLAAAVVFGGLLAALVITVGVTRLCTRLLEPGRVYPLYGRHYTAERLVARASNNPILTNLFGDSVAIVHYLRALGYEFGVIEQTGSNFGLDVRQELPALSRVGSGTMVSDGLSIMNAEFSSTAFRVMPVSIGNRNYLGNTISFPPGARTGDDVLFATKAMVPIAGPVRSRVGLLGSPCFEIPRSVRRDRQFEHLSTGEERIRRLRRKTRHNVATMALHLLIDCLLLTGVILIGIAPLGGAGIAHWVGTVGAELLELSFVVALFVLAERTVCGFRSLQPRTCSIYQREFWRHERFWKLAPTAYVHLFDGTPFKPMLWRLLGVPIGRGVFDDGLSITERTLVRIGDRCTFAMGSHLQSHTLEDGIFKSEEIELGDDCTVGTGALVNYGAVMDRGSQLAPDSFLIKGSRMEPGSRWGGNPAMEVT